MQLEVQCVFRIKAASGEQVMVRCTIPTSVVAMDTNSYEHTQACLDSAWKRAGGLPEILSHFARVAHITESDRVSANMKLER
eukprot:6320550-Lingulodinium_polyedra.AAC.1